ncbi:MAG TPA: MmgE/PrpD family protein [Candidatus Limnocylindrales bacterium]|nr:MmgE/PrpD family protein [Candidatus Limnocylindrales bacterium]
MPSPTASEPEPSPTEPGLAPRSVESLLAHLIVDTPGSAMGADARRAATRQVLDAIGVTLAATREPAGQAVLAATRRTGSGDQARVLGTALRCSVLDAAWTNGSLCHLIDFDDTGFSHPTACIMPAAVAVGEWLGARGSDVLEAIILGYEVFERLAASARPVEPELRERGIHPTSIWGAPAAAAATGRLLGLDVEQVTVALGIAATGAAGLTQQFGSWGKGINAGNAARGGVQAAILAAEGLRGAPDAISGRYGLFTAVVGLGRCDLSGVARDLGQRWSVVEPGLGIKRFPACTSTLRAVDAMLQLATAEGYDPAAVERIVVDVHPDLLHTLRFRRPSLGFNGKFSLDYTVAAAALDRGLTIETFSDEAATRPAFRAMLERVELREHPEWPLARRYETPVTVELADGTVRAASVPAFRGSFAAKLSDDEVRAKYLSTSARALPAERASRSAEAIWALDTADDLGSLLDLLAV